MRYPLSGESGLLTCEETPVKFSPPPGGQFAKYSEEARFGGGGKVDEKTRGNLAKATSLLS